MAMNPEPHPPSDTSPNKRLKTLMPELDNSPPQSPPFLIPKGKSKIQDGTSPIKEEAESESADCCGICLSEAGVGGVSRGCIDCCNHYFCFICIMEWAKVESRCPLCKRRFSTIRRPLKPPVFTYERVVRVPVRDQVYHHFGNVTTGPPDLYSEVKCSVCHGTADESFLLLCDLCDSAAHTYCVGLGVTVPEGDWFCLDCTLLKDEHLKSETNTTNEVSVSEIVREPCAHAVQRYRSISSDSRYLPPPSSADDETRMTHNMARPSPRSLEVVTRHATNPNARTLRLCRNLHDRIRIMRENWNRFRSGIIRFSSGPDGSNISIEKSVTCINGPLSVSSLNQPSGAHGRSSDITNDNKAYEIDKAWKMMDKAKSMKHGGKRSSVACQGSKYHLRKLNAVKNADHMTCTHLSSDCWQTGQKNLGGIRPGHHHYNLEKDYYKQSSSVSEKQKQRRHSAGDINSYEGSLTIHSPKHQVLGSSKGVQTPFLCNVSLRSGEKLPAEKLFERPTCLSSSVVSEPVGLNVNVKEANHLYSHSNVKHPIEKSELKKICVDIQKYNDAKSEIQSLVKLNLKLQTKGEKLEVDVFKEVARLATHSILAACGLEHPKPGSCSIPGFMCSHQNEVQKLQKLSLMPNSCRECFYVFVKEMVNTVMLQRKRISKQT